MLLEPALVLFGYIYESTIYGGALAHRSRTSRAPLIRKFGKPIKPRKLGIDVIVRTNAAQTLGTGREVSEGGAQECHLFLARFLRKENSVLFVMSANDWGG